MSKLATEVRNWLCMKSHCSAIHRVLDAGSAGEVYNVVSGWNEKPNIDIVHTIGNLRDPLRPRSPRKSYREQFTSVIDRLARHGRYAIDTGKLGHKLRRKPAEPLKTGIRKTVGCYLNNPRWIGNVQSGHCRKWVEQNYSKRFA